MKLQLAIAAILLAGLGAAPIRAKAVLNDSQGLEVGVAYFTQESQGVRIDLEVSRLAPGQHGIHIHTVGRCDPPDFATAEGHYNPQGHEHGLANPKGPHAGDLPNLTVRPDGTTHTEMIASRLQLTALLDQDGAALIIHADPDDNQSNPAGKSGTRVACGVIVPTR